MTKVFSEQGPTLPSLHIMANSPNVLWITTDRQRFDTLGCYGNPHVATPNLDRLAAEGALFERAFAQSPVCSPSRASFLTGRYPRTTRVCRNGQALPPTERLISRLLADEGYMCGHGGKLHLAPGHVAEWCERRIDDGYVVMDWSIWPPGPPANAYAGWLVEKGVEFRRTPVGDSEYIFYGMPAEHSNAGWTAQRAINFLTVSATVDRPWFFTCSFEDPHEPFDPPREFLDPYLADLDQVPLPRYTPGELEDKPAFQRHDRGGVWGSGAGYFAADHMDDTDHRLIRAAYWAKIAHIDYQVGRVLEALRATGQEENTLVLFNADHGEMLGDHGIYFQGCYFYPEMIQVPLLLRLPGQIPAGFHTRYLVELVDLAPTVLAALGLPAYAGMQGRSLWPLLTGQSDAYEPRLDLYSEYYQSIPGGYRPFGGAYATHLRSDHYALTVAHNLSTGELYDLQEDPGEVTNLWNQPQVRDLQSELLVRLSTRMAETIDPLPPTEAVA
jgi:arylsulfatase